MPTDPYKYFRIEARELTERLSKDALAIERQGPDAESVKRMLRAAHTLKGAARVVKEAQIADLAHHIEDLLAPARQGDAVSPECVNGVLSTLDAIGGLVAALGAEKPAGGPEPAPDTFEEPVEAVRADRAEMDALLDGVAEAHARLGVLRRTAGGAEDIVRLTELVTREIAAERDTRPERARLRLAVAELSELATRFRRTLSDGLDQVDVELRQVQDSAERLRMLPVESLFVALERTARDAAQSLGKRVAFVGKGGDVRLDAHVLRGVERALVQAVRNAVAHGIEPEAERRASGKPREGRVSVSVERAGRRVAFTCRDDGAGVDLNEVRRAARAGGVAGADTLSKDALIDLLLKGGLTTSAEVNAVAGRGIGLDVVRDAAKRLNGSLELDTEAGRGTALRLIVPVSVASLEVLLVQAAGRHAAIPLDAVRSTLRLQTADLAGMPGRETILFDGKVVPFTPLARAFATREASAALVNDARSAVVVEASGALAALGVERLRGTGNVVLRALPELAPADRVVAGASLDVEGRPELVLDPESLVALAQRTGGVSAAQQPPQKPILVVDDSLTTRMLEQSILESAGYAVEVAVSAEEALEKAHKTAYALCLVDVEMPGMDGFELVRTMRADPVLRQVPAILVTSRAAAEDRARGEEVGANDYVVKGEFNQNALLERIRGLIR
jgi:two-component system, chemotaxis family, sensor kinase CheA